MRWGWLVVAQEEVSLEEPRFELDAFSVQLGVRGGTEELEYNNNKRLPNDTSVWVVLVAEHMLMAAER